MALVMNKLKTKLVGYCDRGFRFLLLRSPVIKSLVTSTKYLSETSSILLKASQQIMKDQEQHREGLDSLYSLYSEIEEVVTAPHNTPILVRPNSELTPIEKIQDEKRKKLLN